MTSRIRILAFAVLLALPVTGALAQDSNTTVIVPSVLPPQANPSPQTVEAETMVCRAGHPLIGTRFSGPRVCKTQRQWDAEMHDAQDNISKSQIRGCLGSGACPK
jgi:hypothetical protein